MITEWERKAFAGAVDTIMRGTRVQLKFNRMNRTRSSQVLIAENLVKHEINKFRLPMSLKQTIMKLVLERIYHNKGL
jgi:hypothetical protein